MIQHDLDIAPIMRGIDRHGYMYTYWCMRQHGIPRMTSVKMLWVARCRADHEYWSGGSESDAANYHKSPLWL